MGPSANRSRLLRRGGYCMPEPRARRQKNSDQINPRWGRGLLLAGGNGIGGNAGQSVRATLLCEVANPVLHDTGLVPLELNGDFQIDDVLNPAPPADCASPVLLIRNPGGAWFAAGILKRENDDD